MTFGAKRTPIFFSAQWVNAQGCLSGVKVGRFLWKVDFRTSPEHFFFRPFSDSERFENRHFPTLTPDVQHCALIYRAEKKIGVRLAPNDILFRPESVENKKKKTKRSPYKPRTCLICILGYINEIVRFERCACHVFLPRLGQFIHKILINYRPIDYSN